MSTTGNPLIDMTESMTGHGGTDDAPNAGFRDTALPGFKQALTASR